MKAEFQDLFDDTLRGIPSSEKLVVGADLNGHVGENRAGFERHIDGCGYGTRNEQGEAILRMAQAHDLAIVNTYFQKKVEHLITFKSGPNSSQIDYILVRRDQLKGVKDCKVIPGECLAAQHRIVVMDYKAVAVVGKITKRRCGRIKWWQLQGPCKEEFQKAIASKWESEDFEGNSKEIWEKIAETLTEAAGVVLGKTKGGKSIQKETAWWWNDAVKQQVKDKKTKFKKWRRTRDAADRHK